jgi:hypothetical protein
MGSNFDPCQSVNMKLKDIKTINEIVDQVYGILEKSDNQMRSESGQKTA